jgi:hypothetical protein
MTKICGLPIELRSVIHEEDGPAELKGRFMHKAKRNPHVLDSPGVGSDAGFVDIAAIVVHLCKYCQAN